MIHVLIVDEAESFGGSLVVAGRIVKELNRSLFCASVAIAFRDEFSERTFSSAANVFVLKRKLSYRDVMRLRSRLDTLRLDLAKRVLNFAISVADIVVSAFHSARLALLILREGVAVVHSNNSVEAVVAGLLTGRPVVFHLHGLTKRRPWLMRKCSLVAISEYVRNAAIENKLVGRSICTIPNGVAVQPLKLISGKVARHRLAIPDEAPLVMLPGRVVRWKGQAEFLRAAKEVHRLYPDAHFVLVGGVSDGDPRFLQALMEEAHACGIGESFHCTGYVPDVATYLSAADVVVHASIEPEPFGLVIAEAMALGRPVIASSLGAGPEIITDGEDGLLVDPRDAEMLASRIVMLLNDRMLAARLGAQGRRTVEEKFSAKAMSRAFENLYVRLASTRGGEGRCRR